MAARIPTFRPPSLGPADQRGYEQRADRAADRKFYQLPRWRGLRALYLKRNPLCADCKKAGRLTPANHVHHKLERKDRPDLAFDWENLEAACQPCHNAKRKGQHR